MLDLSNLRKTSATDGAFPYRGRDVCFLEIRDGAVRQYGRFIDEFRAAVRRAIAGESQIIAVWPGEYRSDAFEVDDLAALAAAIKA